MSTSEPAQAVYRPQSVLRNPPQGLEKRFVDLCQSVLPELGLRLYDLDYLSHSGELRVYIFDEKSGSAQLEDCIKVDHALTPFIDTETWMPEKLTLEVSSPGIFRELSTLWHFEAVVGQMVSLTLFDSLDELFPETPKALKGNKKIKVRLKRVVSDEAMEIEAKGQLFELPFRNVKKANLELDNGAESSSNQR